MKVAASKKMRTSSKAPGRTSNPNRPLVKTACSCPNRNRTIASIFLVPDIIHARSVCLRLLPALSYLILVADLGRAVVCEVDKNPFGKLFASKPRLIHGVDHGAFAFALTEEEAAEGACADAD